MKDYSKIRTYFKENLGLVIAMSITGLFFDGLMWILPILEGKAINSLYSNDKRIIIFLVSLFLGFVLFVQINRFFKRYLVRILGNKIALKMRQISLENLLSYDIDYFMTHSIGDILNRNLTDIYDTAEGIRKITTEIFDTFVLLIGYIASMFILDYEITFLILIPILLSIIFARLLKNKIYQANKDYKEYLSSNKEITLTLLNNELFYRGLGVSESYDKLYYNSIRILRKKSTKALLLQSSMEPIYQAIALLGVFIIVFLGGYKVINNEYLIGTLTSYLTTYLLVARKASKVGKIFNAYQAFNVSFMRAKELLFNNKKTIPDINFNDLDKLVLIDFAPYNSKIKLPKFNFMLEKGEIIGVCGKIHCGKSTFLNSLTGFYKYEGKAFLNGVEIKKLAASDMKAIAISSSNVCLFSDTLKNNITFNEEGDLNKALYTSNLYYDLKELGGLNATISHTNQNISGGQARRLLVARALFLGKKVILLDDPFQSLNKDLAIGIMKKLKENYGDKIIILVSNNKDILKETSKIIFILSDKYLLSNYNDLTKNSNFSKLIGV